MSQASSYPSETARSFLRSKTRMGWELTHTHQNATHVTDY
jgi:hypothetical protein